MDPTPPVVLDNRLRAAEQSAREIVASHDEAMLCLDAEDLIDEVIDIHDMIQRDIERVHPDGTSPAELGRIWYRVYQRFEECISAVAKLIVRVEAIGFEVSRRDALVELAQQVRSITSFGYDRVVQSMEAVGAKHARSLDEVMRELRDRS